MRFLLNILQQQAINNTVVSTAASMPNLMSIGKRIFVALLGKGAENAHAMHHQSMVGL